MTRLGFIRSRLLAAPPRGPSALVCGILVVAIPTLVRASLDDLVSGTTFVAYYPFILFAAIFLGWRSAAVATVASALTANFLFLYPRYRLFADLDDTLGTLLFILSAGSTG
jgi:K+-sensing histidine kinase KdpD